MKCLDPFHDLFEKRQLSGICGYLSLCGNKAAPQAEGINLGRVVIQMATFCIVQKMDLQDYTQYEEDQSIFS